MSEFRPLLFSFIPRAMACLTVGVMFLLAAAAPPAATADDQQLSAEKLFDRNHIVEVSIDIAESDWDALRLPGRSFADALRKELPESPFDWVKADVTIDGVTISDVGIRKKGFLGSLDEYRPSLKIKFAEYKDQDPVDGLDRLTLNNNKQDPSRLSQYLAYRFFADSGTVAPRCNFARVTVNGNYLGIYSNVESIKPPMLERGFGDGSGALFEGTVTDFYEDFVEKFEKKNKAAKYGPIRQITELLHQDEIDLKALDQLIDLNAFVRFWATESLLGFWDGYNNNQNNYYFYQNPGDSRFYFIPWGADALFTNRMPIPPYTIDTQYVYNQSVLSNRLYRIPEMQERYHAALQELLDKHWNEESLLAEIDQASALIKEHVLEENQEFPHAVRHLRNFVRRRREVLLDEMKDGPILPKDDAKRPFYFKAMGTVTATFKARWYDATPDEQESLGEVEFELELDGEKIPFSSIGVFAEHSKWPPTPAGQPKPPSIVFTGTRSSSGKKMTVGIGLPIDLFRPTDEPVDIGGILIDGQFGWPTTNMHMLSGKATFENAGMTEGAVVQGKVKLAVMQNVEE